LRVRIYDEAGNPLAGPFHPQHLLQIHYNNPHAPPALGHACLGASIVRTYMIPVEKDRVVIRAVDLAGNEDTAAALLVGQGCSDFDADGDGQRDQVDAGVDVPGPCDGGWNGDDDVVLPGDEGHRHGCSAAPGPGLLAGVALVAVLRRRRRATCGSR